MQMRKQLQQSSARKRGIDGKAKPKAKTEGHELSAPIADPGLRHADKGNIRTYAQGVVNAGTPKEAWIPVREASAAQSPDHKKLMKIVKLMFHMHLYVNM